MLLLVSDTNILLDWEDGGRLDALFALGATLAVPDVLLAEELADRAERLRELGLEARPLGPNGIVRTTALARVYRKPAAWTCWRWHWRRRRAARCSRLPWMEVDAQLRRMGMAGI